MDTVTHALIGTAIAEVGFRNKLGPRATIAGAIFASLPDLDIILSISSDPIAMLKYHRAATHSIFLAILAAPILGWIGWKLSKKTGTVLLWILLALFTLFSHDLLDLCTTWGTEILYPFSSKRYAIDALPIVDPLILFPLLGTTLFAIFTKKMRTRKILSGLVLLWCLTYAGTGYLLSEQAITLAKSTKPANFHVINEKAIPNTGTILLWHVVLKNDKGDFYTVSVSSLPQKVFNNEYYQGISNEVTKQILYSDKFRIIRKASDDFLLAQNESKNNKVSFIDMRYAMLAPNGSSFPIFFFNITMDKNNKDILKVERSIPDRHKSGGLKVYLNAIFN